MLLCCWDKCFVHNNSKLCSDDNRKYLFRMGRQARFIGCDNQANPSFLPVPAACGFLFRAVAADHVVEQQADRDADQEADELQGAQFLFKNEPCEQEGKKQTTCGIEGIDEADGQGAVAGEDHVAKIGGAVE